MQIIYYDEKSKLNTNKKIRIHFILLPKDIRV